MQKLKLTEDYLKSTKMKFVQFFFFFLLEIPSELYKGIIDGIKLGETEGSKVGKTVFYQLPLLVVLEICAKDIWML